MRAIRVAFALAVLSAPSLGRGNDFAPAAPLSTQAIGDARTDFLPGVATDGGGTWITVFGSGDPAIGVPPDQYGTAIARSIDDGDTWSSAHLLRPEFAQLFTEPAVAASDHGVWVVATGLFSLAITRSTDHGATWDPPVTLTPDPHHGDHNSPDLATDNDGTWVVVWGSDDATFGATYTDILVSRSTDDGSSWSTPVPLASDSVADGLDDYRPAIVTDGSGTWVVVWEAFPVVKLVRSTDNGATWSPPVTLVAPPPWGAGSSPDIATDRNGRWVIVWYSGDDWDVTALWKVVSNDNGATWSDISLLTPYFEIPIAGGAFDPRVVAMSTEEWRVLWGAADSFGGLGGSVNLYTSSSRDGGVSWSSPSTLTARARHKGSGDDTSPALAYSPDGTTIAVWSSNDSFGGTTGTDYDIVFSASRRECPTTAREDCLTSTEPSGSSLSIKDSLIGTDRLNWKLRGGQATGVLDLGDPTATDGYVVCLYEKLGASPGLIAEWNVDAGTMCGSAPCWTAGGGQVEYRDSSQLHGPVKTLRIRGGTDGQTSIQLSAGGPVLGPPRLPLDTSSPVRIQLGNLGTGTCWEGVHDQARTNDSGKFISTSD